MSGVYGQRNSGEKQETEDFAESRMHGQTIEVAELLSVREVIRREEVATAVATGAVYGASTTSASPVQTRRYCWSLSDDCTEEWHSPQTTERAQALVHLPLSSRPTLPHRTPRLDVAGLNRAA